MEYSSDSHVGGLASFRSEFSASLRKEHLEGILLEKRKKLLGISTQVSNKSVKPTELYHRLFDTADKSPGKLTTEILDVLTEIKVFSANTDHHRSEFFSTFITESFIRMSVEGISLDDSCSLNSDTKAELIWIWCNLTVTEEADLLQRIWKSELVAAVVKMIENNAHRPQIVTDGLHFLTHMFHQFSEGVTEQFNSLRFDHRIPPFFISCAEKHHSQESLIEAYINYIKRLFCYAPFFQIDEIQNHFLSFLTVLNYYKCEFPERAPSLLLCLKHFLKKQDRLNLTLACQLQTPVNLSSLLKQHHCRTTQALAADILTALLRSDKAGSVAQVDLLSPRTCSLLSPTHTFSSRSWGPT